MNAPPLKVLLCWPYDRDGFVAPFRSLEETGAFHFTYLYETSCEVESEVCTSSTIRYWEEFSSAHEILETLKPEVVVFRGTGSPRPIALNVAAKRAGIRTYLLQHGLEYTVEDGRRATRAAQAGMAATASASPATFVGGGSGTKRGIEFLLRSLRGVERLDIPLILAYTAFVRYSVDGPTTQRSFRFPARMPSARIRHSLHDAAVAVDIDGSSTPRIIIGNPEYDQWFRPNASEPAPAERSSPAGSYYLFIDSIVADPAAKLGFMSPAEAIRIYEKAAAFAAARGKRLVVKLHPYRPTPSWLPRHLPNVDWVTQAKLPQLLRGAVACFGYFSTLTLMAAWAKPVCLLSHIHLRICDDLAASGVLDVVWAHDFDPSTFTFRTEVAPEDRARYERMYFWRTDGHATERLGDVLLHGLNASGITIES